MVAARAVVKVTALVVAQEIVRVLVRAPENSTIASFS